MQICVEISKKMSNHSGSLKGKILTVLGPVLPEDLGTGTILPHEQLFPDFRKLGDIIRKVNHGSCGIPQLPDPPDNSTDLFTLSNLGMIRQYPYSYPLNLVLDSEQDQIDELTLFKEVGGCAVCEVTPIGPRRKSESLVPVSKASGIHIVCGTGYYVDAFMTDEERLMSVDELSRVMVDEIITGIPDTNGVRCGIIGEIGCSWPLTVNERKVLQGAAQAQQHTGAPLMIHPGKNPLAPFEIIDILRNAGADLSRTVIGHIERTLFDPADFIRLAETGCISELDLFGTECSFYQSNPRADMPSDAQRIAIVKMLCDKGYADRVFISHDIHTKHRMVKYGGHGYRHIPINIVPKMRDRGISDTDIEKITITNPKQWLTFC